MGIPNENKGKTKQELKRSLHGLVDYYIYQFGPTWPIDAIREVLEECSKQAQARRALNIAIFRVLNNDLEPLSHIMSVFDSLP